MSIYTKTSNLELIEYLEERDADGKLIRDYDPSRGEKGLLVFAKDKNNLVYGSLHVNGRKLILYRRIPETLNPEHTDDKLSIFTRLLDNLQASHGYCGVVDDCGKIIIPAEYANLEPFTNNVLLCQKRLGLGLLSLSGEVIIEPKYRSIATHNESVFAVTEFGKDGKVGFMDFRGKVVIPFEYENVDEEYHFSKGIACVAKKDSSGNLRYGYINHNNEVILPFQFSRKVDFDDKETIENEEKKYHQWRGQYAGYTINKYLISIDGSIHFNGSDSSNIIDYPVDLDNDPLDAYEGDDSNRWNTD